MRTHLRIFLPVLVLSSAALAQQPAPQPSIAVLDFEQKGASDELTSAVEAIVAHELQRLGVFRVSTAEMVRTLIAHERTMQLLGCGDDARCVSDVLGSLDVDHLITGKVTKVGGAKGAPATFTLELALLNPHQSRREASSVQNAVNETELLERTTLAVHQLSSVLLRDKTGALVLTASEVGATVKVDDEVAGVTPLGGRLSVPAGPHRVQVEKEGFVVWQKELRIQPNGVTEDNAWLVPSPDFIDQYEASATRMRVGAWIATGLAVGGFAAAGYFQYGAQKTFGAADTPGTFAFHRQKLLEGLEQEDGVDHRAASNTLKAQIENSQRFSYIGAGVGAAAGATALFFWIAGDAPGKYARYKEAPAASAALMPTDGGAYGSVAFTF